jgi:sterol desaturase/sphingolipid hydroxylase (fatty acid hydroxylase superfamily)
MPALADLAAAHLGRPLLFAGLSALAFAPLEHLAPAHASRRTSWSIDLAFATAGQVITHLLLVVVAAALLARLDAWSLDRPLLSGLGQGPLTFAATVLVGLLLFDLGGYLYHRAAHALPCLWRLHALHHTSEQMDWLASFRQHPLEILLLTLCQNAPLVLLGVPLGAHATVLALLKLAGVFVHANLRLPAGRLRFVVATPRFHHRHHRRGGPVRNFAALFPAIDLLFGTFSAEESREFGLVRHAP